MPNYHTFRDWPKTTFVGSAFKKTFKKPKKPKNGGVPSVQAFSDSTGTDLSNLNMTAPVGIVAGELLLMIIGIRAVVTTGQAVNTPAGWAKIDEVYSALSDVITVAFVKKATGSEGTVNVSWSDNNSTGQSGTYMRLTGTNADDPVNNYNFAASPALASVHVIPAIQTTVKKCLAFYGLGFDGGDGFPFSVSGAGWSEQTEHQSQIGSGGASGTNGTKDVTAIGTTGDATVTASVSDGASFCQIALNPVGKSEDYYLPGMMTFDGSTGYFSKTGITVTGNKTTFIAQFNRASFAGGADERIGGVSASQYRGLLIVYPSDFATATRRLKLSFLVQNSSGTAVCRVFSSNIVVDGDDHTLLAAYDGDNGTAQLYVDGVSVLDTGNPEHTLTTGTLGTASAKAAVGADPTGAFNLFDGDIGYFGYEDQYLTNPLDFMTADGPKQLDVVGWTEFGGQPTVFNQYGNTAEFNLGSAGNMTKNGTITGPS